MGIQTLTTNLSGLDVSPEDPSAWEDWISATSSRNFIAQNTLMDWLSLYGKSHGFKQDTEYTNYDPRTNFSDFILWQGKAFEDAVIRYLSTLIPITTVSDSPSQIRNLGKAKETFQSMVEGLPVIGQGVLWDAESRTYGARDLLVRSDVLNDLIANTLTQDEVTVNLFREHVRRQT